MKLLLLSALALAVLVWPMPLSATTIYVDDDAPGDLGPGDPSVSDPIEDGSADHPYDAIQEGIDSAVGGDTVLVLDGTYTGFGNRDLDFLGKAITVQSENGPAATIIDCEGTDVDPHRGFHFHSGETGTSVVDGFSIVKGYMTGAYPNNGGGGILCVSSSPSIINCVIARNTAKNGGGIFCYDNSGPTIRDCAVSNNIAAAGGGTYCSYSSSPLIEDCRIVGNSASGDGGGIVCFDQSDATIRNCIIKGNTAGDDGGGIACYYSSTVTIMNCMITSNSAGSTTGNYGGGIVSTEDSSVGLSNCAITGNSANEAAGMICTNGGDATIANCTFTNNSAGVRGGALYCLWLHGSETIVTVTNSVLWGDSPQEIFIDSGTVTVTVTYSCVQDDDPDDAVIYPGMGNLDDDPLFLSGPAHDYYLSQVASGQAIDSPCVDTGNDTAANLGLDILTTRTDQVFDAGTVDIGYHAAVVSVIYVDDDAAGDPGPGDPTVSDPIEDGSADHPFDAIQEAIYAASHHDTVIVKDGLYTGIGNRDMDFGGKAITVRSENGPAATIIDCQGTDVDPHRGFHFHSGETADSVLDGFTITNGYVTGDYPYNCGGGILCWSYSSPTIPKCIITGCVASAYGGGLFCWNSSPTISDCKISNNTAGKGGGIRCSNSWLTITNSVITGNTAILYGGGIYAYTGMPMLTNCLISGNTPYGMRCVHSAPIVRNCTFSHNGDGVAIRCWGSDADVVVTNSILWGNGSDPISIGGVPATPVVTYSNIQGGWAGEGNIDLDPLFVHGPLHDYYLSQIAAGEFPDSPCVDAGSDTAANLGLDELITRTDGIPDSGVVDMGYHAPYALRIYRIVPAGDDIRIYWSIQEGLSYVVEWSEDRSAWNEVAVGATSTWTDVGVLAGAPAGTKRYYRVREAEEPALPLTQGADESATPGSTMGRTRPSKDNAPRRGGNVRHGVGNVRPHDR